MNRAERKERATRLCRGLSKRVSEIASPGLGLWPDAWETVEEPSAEFLDLLDAWEESGDDTAKGALEFATMRLVNSWMEANRRFEEAGWPEVRQEVPA